MPVNQIGAQFNRQDKKIIIPVVVAMIQAVKTIEQELSVAYESVARAGYRINSAEIIIMNLS